jgi:hypothetical protein
LTALVLYTGFNFAVYNKNMRQKLVTLAQKVDLSINQRFASKIGMPIETNTYGLEITLAEFKQKALLEKLYRLPFSKKRDLADALRFDYRSFNFYKTLNGRYVPIKPSDQEAFFRSAEGQRQLDKILDAMLEKAYKADSTKVFSEYAGIKKQMLLETIQTLDTKLKTA